MCMPEIDVYGWPERMNGKKAYTLPRVRDSSRRERLAITRRRLKSINSAAAAALLTCADAAAGVAREDSSFLEEGPHHAPAALKSSFPRAARLVCTGSGQKVGRIRPDKRRRLEIERAVFSRRGMERKIRALSARTNNNTVIR